MKEVRSVRLDPELIETIEKKAHKEIRSFSGMVEYILKKYFDK